MDKNYLDSNLFGLITPFFQGRAYRKVDAHPSKYISVSNVRSDNSVSAINVHRSKSKSAGNICSGEPICSNNVHASKPIC